MLPKRVLTGLLVAVVSLFVAPSTRPATANTPIGPPQVLARVIQVQADLEHLQNEMGKGQVGPPVWQAVQATPHEVFFQALALFQKANRFSYEHTRRRGKQPKIPQGDIQPAQVWAVVDAAGARLQRVKAALGINAPNPAGAPDASKTPTDVFNALLQANRQLNLLLDQGVSPSHVLQQVAMASEYTAQLLTRFPGAVARPDAPDFESQKRPTDVFKRLVDCTRHMEQILQFSGLRMLTLQRNDALTSQVSPNDVYSLATLLVAELVYLHGKMPNASPPPKVYRRQQRTFPAHVYQQAGVLKTQLETLLALVAERPRWLRAAAK